MKQKFIHILLLTVVCYFSFFVHNEMIFADIMESRNLVTAREMVAENNWLIPTMNGELRLEKPPLPTWVAACIEMISPDNLALQRTAAGIMASILVFFLYGLVYLQTHSRLLGLFGSLILCTSFNIILMGRVATWDIYCHSFMLGGIYFLFRSGEKKGRCWKEFIGAGIFMGLSFLGKGPVSFYALLLPFLVAWIFVYRPSFRGKIGGICLMVTICLLISFWWPILLFFTHKDLFLAVMDKESTAWLEHNVRPWYYYWKFFAETGIWALILVTTLIWPYWKKRMSFKKEYLLAVCWVFMILIFLSLLPEKKTRYLLPILIPSALVVSHFFYYYQKKMKEGRVMGKEKWIWRVNTFLIAGIIALLPVGIYFFFYASGKISLGTLIGFTLCIELIAFWLFYSASSRKVYGFLLGIVGLFMIVEAMILPVIVKLFNNPNLNSIHAVRKMKRLESIPFYYDCEEELRIEIVYEAGRKILPYCFHDELHLPDFPFVLVSEKQAEQVLSPEQLEHVKLELIGRYDDNKRLENRPLFVRYVTLITQKK